MTLNESVVNYKILDLIKLYNFDIKFVFIRNHMKKLWNFLSKNICRDGSYHRPPKEIVIEGRVTHHPLLKMHF